MCVPLEGLPNVVSLRAGVGEDAGAGGSLHWQRGAAKVWTETGRDCQLGRVHQVSMCYHRVVWGCAHLLSSSSTAVSFLNHASGLKPGGGGGEGRDVRPNTLH